MFYSKCFAMIEFILVCKQFYTESYILTQVYYSNVYIVYLSGGVFYSVFFLLSCFCLRYSLWNLYLAQDRADELQEKIWDLTSLLCDGDCCLLCRSLVRMGWCLLPMYFGGLGCFFSGFASTLLDLYLQVYPHFRMRSLYQIGKIFWKWAFMSMRLGRVFLYHR